MNEGLKKLQKLSCLCFQDAKLKLQCHRRAAPPLLEAGTALQGQPWALGRARTRAARPAWILQLAEENTRREAPLTSEAIPAHFLPAAVQQS